MANSLKTNALSSLARVTDLQDTDLIPIGTDNGATLKAVRWSTVKESIPTFTQEVKDISLSASANYVSGTLDIGKSGYTAIAISGWQTSDSAGIFPGKLTISGTSLYYIFRKTNYSSGSWTGTANIRILYVKDV